MQICFLVYLNIVRVYLYNINCKLFLLDLVYSYKENILFQLLYFNYYYYRQLIKQISKFYKILNLRF